MTAGLLGPRFAVRGFQHHHGENLVGSGKSDRIADVERAAAAGRDGASPEAVRSHYDVSNAFYRLWLGATIAVPVTAGAAPSGAAVTLQRKSGSKWVTVKTGSIVSGKAKLLWKPTSRSTYYLRVLVSGMGVVRSSAMPTAAVIQPA